MWRTILGVYLAVMVVVALVNAVYMLVSPQAWFRLPGSIGLNGSLTQKRYSSGWGAAQVKVLGATLLAFFAWLAYHATSK